MKQHILINLCALISFIQIFSSAPSEPKKETFGGITKRRIGNLIELTVARNGKRIIYNEALQKYRGTDAYGNSLIEPAKDFMKYNKRFEAAKAEATKPYLMQ